MFGECHAHLMMDGKNYRHAVECHRESPNEALIRSCLSSYRDASVSFVRDGGDFLGVSAMAKKLACEYGIDYRTPLFAIHKKGHYGSIVGKAFSDLKDYHHLVLEAKQGGADFIKIMTTGILDFNNQGEITGEPLDAGEVKEMVHIAHEEGFAVMSHTNGVYGVRAALSAGVDSLEHGNYMDEETVELLSESHTVWVPTLVPIRNLAGCGRFDDIVIDKIIKQAESALRLAYDKHVKIALGSDAGAYRVAHGAGICQEYEAFQKILDSSQELDDRLYNGEQLIRERFKCPR